VQFKPLAEFGNAKLVNISLKLFKEVKGVIDSLNNVFLFFFSRHFESLNYY